MANFRLGSGLFVTDALVASNVSLDLKFEPSVGILARKVDKLGADIRSFREPLKRIVKEVMIPSIRQNFDAGGRPSWVPLSEFTIRRKALKGQSAAPLIGTGRLRRVMGTQKIWNIDTEKAMILDLPPEVWYGKVHQAGHEGAGSGGTVQLRTPTGSVNVPDFGDSFESHIPARPFVSVQNEDIDAMERIMTEWVGEKVRRAGL